MRIPKATFGISAIPLKIPVSFWSVSYTHLDADTLFSFDKFRDYYSHDDIDIILDQALKIVTEQVAPTNEEGDTIQARFEDGAVTCLLYTSRCV